MSDPVSVTAVFSGWLGSNLLPLLLLGVLFIIATVLAVVLYYRLKVGREDVGLIDGRVLDDLDELHRGLVAPSGVLFEPEDAKSGAQWTKTIWIEGWPDEPHDGFITSLFSEPGIETDISIHVTPRDSWRAQHEIEDQIGSLEAEFERKRERHDVDARGVQKDLEDYEAIYDLVRNTKAEVFDTSMYVTVRSEDRAILDSVSKEVTARLRQSGLMPVTAVRRQEAGLRSTSPTCRDDLGKQTTMLGGAIGAMFPFASGTLIQESGVEYGTHAFNSSPVILDRFTQENGYNMLVVGNIGSGKSFATKLHLIRRMMYDEDTIVVILDPLKGFIGVNEALGGERIVIGGSVGLNPLDLRETPPEVLEQAQDLDPYGSKLKDVIGFFETYFALRGDSLGGKRGTLEQAIARSYRQHGITRDPDTHGNRSPTIRDVIDVLVEMGRDPEEFARSQSAEEIRTRERHASQLLVDLEPFMPGGEYENLARETEIDVTGSNVVYLDLQQQETRGDIGLMMHLLFSAVYERAKQEAEKRIVFVIDEARYVMKDTASLAFLEQAVRHSRHYDLSITFVTQTLDEFFARDEAKAIADNCSLKLLFRIEGIDEDLAERLDLTPQQREFVRTATPGNEGLDYSEALLGVSDEGWYPIHVRANELEKSVIDGVGDHDVATRSKQATHPSSPVGPEIGD